MYHVCRRIGRDTFWLIHRAVSSNCSA